MKSSSLFLQCLALTSSAWAASSSSREGLIYTLDTAAKGSNSKAATAIESQTIDFETAQLIIDRRLGTSLKQNIGTNVDEKILENINHFGGAQRTLLSASEVVRKVGVVVDGWDFAGSDSLNSPASLEVKKVGKENVWDEMTSSVGASGVCSFAQSGVDGLKVEVQLQDKHCGSLTNEDIFGAADEKTIDSEFVRQLASKNYLPTGSYSAAYVHFSFPKASNDRISKAFDSIYNIASANAKAGSHETTILVLPTPPKSSKRSTAKAPRSLPQEEPLKTAIPVEPFVTPLRADNNTKFTPLPSNLKIPSCFDTESACQSSTNNCSSHGSCILFHAPTAGDDPQSKSCWTCSCRATTSNRTVINWGGNACQKQDISTEFWLFAGFGVTMTALVIGGIGMLYSMGSQELPGVLGAGVGGSRAR